MENHQQNYASMIFIKSVLDRHDKRLSKQKQFNYLNKTMPYDWELKLEKTTQKNSKS